MNHTQILSEIQALRRVDIPGFDPEGTHLCWDEIATAILQHVADGGDGQTLARELLRIPSPVTWGWYAWGSYA